MAAPRGNRNAAKAKEWEAAIRHELENFESSSIKRGQALRAIAKNVVELATKGDWRAVEEVANRIDGKPSQSVDVTGLIEHRDVTDITDDQLADIATGRSTGTAEAQTGETQSPGVH